MKTEIPGAYVGGARKISYPREKKLHYTPNKDTVQR